MSERLQFSSVQLIRDIPAVSTVISYPLDLSTIMCGGERHSEQGISLEIKVVLGVQTTGACRPTLFIDYTPTSTGQLATHGPDPGGRGLAVPKMNIRVRLLFILSQSK